MRKLSLLELERLSVEEFKNSAKAPLIVICDNIRSAMNIGSVFRTADAMGITAVYLCGISATPPNKEITKTAIGATESVDWQYFKTTLEAVDMVKSKGYKVYAVEQTDASVELLTYSFDKGDQVAIILGNEVMGVSDDVLPHIDGALEIAQYGTKHSLNVAVCAGIVVHHIANAIRP